MAWLDETQIRNKFNLHTGHSSQIQSAIESAGRKMRRWISEAHYAEAIGEEPADADELLRYQTILDAHAFLTMYYLAVSVGSKLAPDGFIKQAQSPSGTGLQSATNQYLTPAELAAKKQEYYDMAWDIVEPYADVETAETGAVAAFTYPTAIAVTADW